MLACFALVVLCFAQNSPKKPEGSGHDSQAQPNVTSPSPVTVNCNQSAGTVAQHDEQKTPKGDAPIEWANWALVLIGGITAWAVWYQSRKTAEATQAMRDSLPLQKTAAEAADKNADALVNSERAWVMADLRFQTESGIVHTTNPLGERTAASVELQIRNCGPTPAWVFQQWIRLEISPKILMSDTPYPSPSQFDRIEGAIGQGASHMSYEILPIAKDDRPIVWQTEIFGDGWATEQNRLNTYIYGIVTYRDAFDSMRETYFGYRVDGRKLERIPSDAYNKNI